MVAANFATVMVVDDERSVLNEFTAALQPRRVVPTADAAAALDIATRKRPQLALVDLWLDARSIAETSLTLKAHRSASWGIGVAIDLVRKLRSAWPSMKIVMITGGFSEAYRSYVLAAGADGALPKFLGPERIMAIIEAGELDREPTYPRPMSLARHAYEYLTKVYVENYCNAAQTSRDLSIARDTLYRKLREPAQRR